MKHRRIKLPDGRKVSSRIDPLDSLLRDESVIPRKINPVPGQQTEQELGHESSASADIVDVNNLAGCEVTILGAGSVGSYVASSLAAASIIINLFDFKSVQHKHTKGGRTIYEKSQVGRYKVDASKEKFERDYPGTTVNANPYNVAKVPDREFEMIIQRSYALILALDDPEQILRFNDLAYPLVEIIQVAMHARALSGHIGITIPYVTPCLRCTLEITKSTDIRRLDGEPGNSWHIRRVAHEAAMIAVDIMYAKVTGQNITRWDPSKNLVYIANTQQELSPEGPGLRFEGSRKRPGCPICNSR